MFQCNYFCGEISNFIHLKYPVWSATARKHEVHEYFGFMPWFSSRYYLTITEGVNGMSAATLQCLETQCRGSHSNHNHGHSAGISHPVSEHAVPSAQRTQAKNQTAAFLPFCCFFFCNKYLTCRVTTRCNGTCRWRWIPTKWQSMPQILTGFTVMIQAQLLFSVIAGIGAHCLYQRLIHH